MSKSKSGVSSIRIIVYGYIIIIVVQLLLQVSRMLMPKVSFELGAIALMLFAWFVLLLGFHMMSSRGKEFKRGRFASLLGLLATAGEAFYAYRYVKAGMGMATFIDMYVLFFWFISMCVLLYTFSKALKGMQPIVEMTDERLASKYPRTALLVGTIVVLTLVFLPVMQMLPKVTGYVGTLTLGVVMALAQGYVCKLLLDGYHAVRANTDEAKEAAAAERVQNKKSEKSSKERSKEAALKRNANVKSKMPPESDGKGKDAGKALNSKKGQQGNLPKATETFDRSFMEQMRSAVLSEQLGSDFWKNLSEPQMTSQRVPAKTANNNEGQDTEFTESDFWI